MPDLRYQLPLAFGELSAADLLELGALKEQILADTGFDCRSYKEHCLRRRIAVRMRARTVHRYSDYAVLLAADPVEQLLLLDAITINVSKFFRNPDLWRALERHVVPGLFTSEARPVRIWSAGCAAGEEPYTIAMMLKEYALRADEEAALERFRIVGTDIDRQILEGARAGRYSEFAFSDTPEDLRRAWFAAPQFTEIKREIRNMVSFECSDLLRDDFETGHQLIVCRNVLIYLQRSVQEQLFSRFYEALAPGGVLVLGKVETLVGGASTLFKPLIPRERVFVKA